MRDFVEIFNLTVAAAEAIGYDPDTKVLTKGILGLVTDSWRNRAKTQKLLSFISYKQSSDPKFKQHYQNLEKKVREYLVWSVPYLFYDDVDDPDTYRRDAKREAEIVKAALKFLPEIEQAIEQ